MARPPPRVAINGHTCRSTVASWGGVSMLEIGAEVRQATGVATNDEVELEVELALAPREVVVPPDIADVLDREPDARRAFDALSHSNKRRHAILIEEARTAKRGSTASPEQLLSARMPRRIDDRIE